MPRRFYVSAALAAVAVLAILDFVQGFNDFLGPLLILTDPDKITAPLALANFKGTTVIAPRYALMFAGSTLATVPRRQTFGAIAAITAINVPQDTIAPR